MRQRVADGLEPLRRDRHHHVDRGGLAAKEESVTKMCTIMQRTDEYLHEAPERVQEVGVEQAEPLGLVAQENLQ